MQIIYIILIILLIILFTQDWKSRSVHWYLFPSILACTIFTNIHSIPNYWSIVLLNLSIVFVQLGIVVLYLKIKGYQSKQLTTHYFALGDILFLLVLSCSFSSEVFLIFNICSILISLIIARVMKFKTIPFAGIQSLLLALVCIFQLIIN